ncbi:MAG: type IX secretion system sortase PorU [Candidatus Neomarinimicrobiota bacterium]
MNQTQRRQLSATIILLVVATTLAGQQWKAVENSADNLTVVVTYPGPEKVYEMQQLTLAIGIPSASLPDLSTDYVRVSPYTSPDRHPYHFEPPVKPVKWDRLVHFRDLHVGLLQISPALLDGDELTLVDEVQFTISFPTTQVTAKKVGPPEEGLYESRIVNWEVAKTWIQQARKVKKRAVTPLPEGEWYRFEVERDGIYQLTAAALQAAGVNTDGVQPASLIMFTNTAGGRPLTATVGAEIPDNLTEVAMRIQGGQDGSFDDEDAIIFYGRGPRGFDSSEAGSVTYTQNPYTDTNVYWLLVPDDPDIEGKRVRRDTTSYADPLTLDYGISYQHLEEDLENPFDSGILWVGAGYSKNQTGSLVFNLAHPKMDVDATVSLSVFGGSSSSSEEFPSHRLRVHQRSTRDSLLSSVTWGGLNIRNVTAELDESLLSNGPNVIVLHNVSNDDASRVHIDWATLKYGRELRWEDIPLEFFGPVNVSPVRFVIFNADANVRVWDITESAAPVEREMTFVGIRGYFETTPPEERMARFIAFSEEDIPEITNVVPGEDLTLSTLRTEKNYSIDHIIIAPEEFLGPAEELMRHRTNSFVAPLETIYNEFSGGVQDPLAVRYFLKWTKEHWRDPATDSFPSFVLLFGDGDYDYRNITGASSNLMPTFQSPRVKGTSSDDRFAYLDGQMPEMSLGRFPAVSVSDADNMVRKTIDYEADPEIGLWRRRLTLIADDFARPNFGPIELTHTRNSEEIADMIPRSLEVQKIYMEDFPEINDGSQFGVTKPDATEALFEILERGTVLLNFIGHGSAYQWAQEGLLTAARGDLTSINTGMKLPVWIAATCSWGRYDNVEGNAMSEEILRLAQNGAVAVISTTGLITFSANKNFVLDLFRSFFPDGNVTEWTLGTVYSSIKNGSAGSELFHLFGDPALKLALPPNTVSIDSVLPDTLLALETGTFSGHLAAGDPSLGEGYVVLYDADRTVTKTYDGSFFSEIVSYTLVGRTLFRGLVPLSGRVFDGSFIVPKDVSYATSQGRLSMYVYGQEDEDLWEGLGVREGLVFAGGTNNPLETEGPLISFRLEDRTVESGDHLPENSDLIISISDPLGVNVTGEVGHAVRLWVDEDESDATDLTEDFVYDPRSHESGSVTFPLDEISRGESLITVEAWDNANNPARKSITLHLTSSEALSLTNVFNYPNPFRQETQFAFEVSQRSSVTIRIFTLAGQLVRELEPSETFMGYSHIDWNGRDDFGDNIAYGAYLYQITATPVEDGKKITRIRKIAKSPESP